jgi:drug/metabolite transporter (DMT)-like permease
VESIAPTPVVFAVLAALGWGVADFAVARLGHELGSRSVFAHAQAGGAVALVAFALVLGVEFPPTRLLVPVGGIGIVGAVAYLALYESLRIGPVAVASPVAATNGAVAAVLGVIVLGERLSTVALVGIGLLSLGVVATSLNVSALRSTLRAQVPVVPGAALAAVAALALGVTMFSLKIIPEVVGLLAIILVVRVVGSVLSSPLLAAGGAGYYRTGAAAVGVLDAAAFAAFVVAVRDGLVAVVSPIASLFAVVTILLAWVLLDEQLSRLQWIGIALVLGGIVLVGGA